jgi:hypothetical protein
MKKTLLIFVSIFCLSFQTANVVNYKMVTLFVYNFARNIQWPLENNTRGAFHLGVWGDSPFLEEASSYMATKKVNDQSIIVRSLYSLKEVNSCHMVFVAPEKMVDIKKIAAISASSSVLLVAMQDGANNNGTGINLFLDNQDNKMKFQINENVLKNKHIKVSKALMDLSYHGN